MSKGRGGVKYDSLVQTGSRERLPKRCSVLRPSPSKHRSTFYPMICRRGSLWRFCIVAVAIAGSWRRRDACAGELNLSSSFGFIAQHPSLHFPYTYCIPPTTSRSPCEYNFLIQLFFKVNFSFVICNNSVVLLCCYVMGSIQTKMYDSTDSCTNPRQNFRRRSDIFYLPK